MVAPVPPLVISIVVALQIPEVMVPTLVKLDPVIVEAKVVPVNVPALTVPKFACTYSVVATFVELSFVAGVGAVGVPVNAGEASGDFKAKLVLIVAISEELAVMLIVFADTFVFNVAMLFECAVMLAVLAFTLFVNVNSAALAVVASAVMAVAFVAIDAVLVAIAVALAVMLAVFADTFVFNVAMLFECAVMLAVLAFTLFVNVNSAALAVVASVVIAVALVAIEAVFVAIAVVFAVMLAVFAAIAVVFAVINPGKVAIVLELTPPKELTVVANDPFPEPVTSPVNVVVAFAAITSVPITKPRFVLAPAAVKAPVPPLAIVIVPLIFAEVILLSATPAFALWRST